MITDNNLFTVGSLLLAVVRPHLLHINTYLCSAVDDRVLSSTGFKHHKHKYEQKLFTIYDTVIAIDSHGDSYIIVKTFEGANVFIWDDCEYVLIANS